MAAIAVGTSYYVGLALLTTLVIVLLVYAYRVWAEIHEEIEPESPRELLNTFEEAYAAGEIDQEELSRVRNLLLQENVNRLEKDSSAMAAVRSRMTEEPPAPADRVPNSPESEEP